MEEIIIKDKRSDIKKALNVLMNAQTYVNVKHGAICFEKPLIMAIFTAIQVMSEKEEEVTKKNMISCKEYVEKKKQELKEEIMTLERTPVLAVIQVDNDKASDSYILGKKKDCREIGIECLHIAVNSSCSQEDLESTIEEINKAKHCNGIIIQLPIPSKYNIEKLQNCISPEKDVDGFRRDSYFKPCTPKGIMDWLEYNNYNLEGKNVTVIGRSNIVGKPLVNMLIDKGATVTCCNSKTKHLSKHTINADVVISAIGKAKFLNSKYFGLPEIIIDVGINRDENGKLCGDVDKEDVEKTLKSLNQKETYITPVPGSVGLLTRLSLIENVAEAYKMQNK